MITAAEILCAALREGLGVPVVTKVPRTRPGLYVRVDVSAPRPLSPVHESAFVIVQVQGHDLEQVLDTLTNARWFLRDDLQHPLVFGWQEQAGPVDFPDPEVPTEPRWQITGEIYYSTT